MTRAYGIDISKWQEYYRPTASPPRPVDFAIQRTSYGLKRDERLIQMFPATIPVKGAYHYYSSAVEWKPQCDLFISLLKPYDFWAWDVEKGYNSQSSSFVWGVVRAMEYLTEQTGKPGLLYVNPDTWNTWLIPVQSDLRKYDLWVAQYLLGRVATNPKLPTTMRADWRFWQYDDKGGGNKGREYGVLSYGLDLDVFNGSIEELRAWAIPAPARICPTCGQVWK
jgi:GH25 family lysozyme M1 (1,4-beta-N-acetylmuramidase)